MKAVHWVATIAGSFKSLLTLIAVGAVAVGYAAGTVAPDYVLAQTPPPHADASILQPLGHGAWSGSDTHQVPDPDNPPHMMSVPVLQASRSHDYGSPETGTTWAQVAYGELGYNKQDEAYAVDTRRIWGHVENIPAGMDVRWRVAFTIEHKLLARVINGPGAPDQGSYSSEARGQSDIHFSIVQDMQSTPLNPARVINDGTQSKTASRYSNQVGEHEIPNDDDEGTHSFGTVDNPKELPMESGTNKARLNMAVQAKVTLKANRPEVEVGGRSRVEIKSGGWMGAYNFDDPADPVLMKQADGETEASGEVK